MTMLEERVSSMEGAYDHLATKEDVQELRGDVNTAIQELRGDVNTAIEELRGATRADIQELRGDMNTAVQGLRGDVTIAMERLSGEMRAEVRAAEVRMIKWGAGMIVGNIIAVAALLRLFV